MYLNCLCTNLAYGLPELNKLIYLLTYLLVIENYSNFTNFKSSTLCRKHSSYNFLIKNSVMATIQDLLTLQLTVQHDHAQHKVYESPAASLSSVVGVLLLIIYSTVASV